MLLRAAPGGTLNLQNGKRGKQENILLPLCLGERIRADRPRHAWPP